MKKTLKHALIATQAKEEKAAEALDDLWEAIDDHPRDGALLTLRVAGDLRKRLLYAVYMESERCAENARNLKAQLS